jgi:hypothetical protein
MRNEDILTTIRYVCELKGNHEGVKIANDILHFLENVSNYLTNNQISWMRKNCRMHLEASFDTLRAMNLDDEPFSAAETETTTVVAHPDIPPQIVQRKEARSDEERREDLDKALHAGIAASIKAYTGGSNDAVRHA